MHNIQRLPLHTLSFITLYNKDEITTLLNTTSFQLLTLLQIYHFPNALRTENSIESRLKKSANANFAILRSEDNYLSVSAPALS